MAFIEPGHFALVLLTPEQYNKMVMAAQPNWFPTYFAMSRLGQTLQQIAMKAMQAGNVDEIKAIIPELLLDSFGVAYDQKKGGPEGDTSALFKDIQRIYGGLFDNWKAGIWHGVGAAYSSAMEQFLSSGQLLYAYKTLMYHTAITPRMRRHWNKTFTPMVPSGSMAWILLRRGEIDWDQFKLYAAYDGWDENGSNLLADSFKMLPSPRQAFYLWTKGQITDEVRDDLYFAGGFDQEWHTALTENWYYTPTLYDLTRLADYIELDQIWALDQLKRRGLKDRDRAEVWKMLQLRPLREEFRALTAKWLWRYQFGRASVDELRDAFIDMGIKSKERELLLEQAEMKYEDELIDEWVEILMWRFRTAIISEEEYLKGLLDLGIKEEKANLMVELEKAKGYYGYY